MPYANLRPSQVILDPENPRLPDGTSSDRQAINRLLDDGAEQLINLAKDMIRQGESNPAELPIAIKSGSKYLILEGNRRFAALKLLKDPLLANEEAYQKAFKRIAGTGEAPKSIYTHVASSREQADHWIVLRHTGLNNGVGVKAWGASQIATHRRRNNKTIEAGTARSIMIANEMEEIYSTDDEILRLVQNVKREKLTNIGRFFSSDVLTALHLTIETDDSGEKVLYARHTASQLRDFFAWAFAYILNKSVDAYKNAAIRSDALREAGPRRPALADAFETPQPLRDVSSGSGQFLDESLDAEVDSTGDDESSEAGKTSAAADSTGTASTSGSSAQGTSQSQSAAGQQQQSERPRKAEAKPEKYLLQDLRLPHHPHRVQNLLKECRSIELGVFPGIACVMARVIVELSVSSQEALALSGASEKDSLKRKILSMLKYLDPEIEHPIKRDKQLAQAYLEASELGIEYLNGFVHNPSLIPDHHLARRFSQAFRPFLERIDTVL
ncbi:hypothetical protein ABGB18_11995 [Nonomuraea sp. B12E4]|uniref:hypothetical protein n=1 Tax=Nonomuraea sp. B12E4 TaxID=3153564 RepID=UPI00325D7610